MLFDCMHHVEEIITGCLFCRQLHVLLASMPMPQREEQRLQD